MSQQDFLFELGCEELPPKALPKLAQSLHDQLCENFNKLSLSFLSSDWFATPRRLAVRFTQLDTAQQDNLVEKLGPAVAAAFDTDGKPKPAALGFAKSCGVTVDKLTKKQTDKGERLAFSEQVNGEKTIKLLPQLITKAITQLPVPKNMRWSDGEAQFSRPVHWMLALLGEKIIPLNLFDIQANQKTFGHRFHAPETIEINQPKEYEEKLANAKVIVSFHARKAKIREQVESIARQQSATAVIKEDLLEEVCALVEWPVALLGEFNKEFLSVPEEALISSMEKHQKYFHLLDSNNQLMAKFITVANIESKNPASVIQGNQKVIRPRLADAQFFYQSDIKQPLASRAEKLKTIIFQQKLGTLWDKTQRVKQLSVEIAKQLNVEKKLVERAAELSKCDLVTDMVGEFADLQGIMGDYYAINDGEDPQVAQAVREIYLPRFADDELPEKEVGLVLAIAEKIDTLVGIFGINQMPTGTKDPFALRRASIGVLRLIIVKELCSDLDLDDLIDQSLLTYQGIQLEGKTKTNLLEYFSARILHHYSEHDKFPTPVIKAVLALNLTKPRDIEKRIMALRVFNDSPESKDLAEANKRVKNILEKSDFDAAKITINSDLFEADEKALYMQIERLRDFVDSKVRQAEYKDALDELAKIKNVVNQFFNNVMINVEDEVIRNNRLALIAELRNLFLKIADISLLQK